MSVDKYVLTSDVLDNEVDSDGNIANKIVAEKGDTLPSSLSKYKDEFVAEGVLIPKDEFDANNDSDWHAPTLNEVHAKENVKAAGYSKSDLEKINEAAEAAATPLQVAPSAESTGLAPKSGSK